MHIHSYTDLIRAALQQDQPQRLLFVFAKAELPSGHTDKQKQGFEQGNGGALAPVLCVDKLPQEAADFCTLVEESRHTGQDWDIVFVSAMQGRAGIAPNSDEAVHPLHMMMNKIQSGMIGDFLTFTREGELVALAPG
ncbi:ribonucleotide reductase subunit alpha [Aliiglaciecola sp. CAU 1673]|uniref:ribonucleotide reductase subunit alpha n=1 Tax=Aliiglaciecola sp. CAU 1673 TaxID=3032595 RepID=UPI0023D9C71F|nr:ribonucleotide reductase subunit alpha [Aliiglaciecola sp. CAU 1673]MDF2177414.1 ribonucleotide reductase subunit alpha [Aliiglaciecola sp. CAU 1673]